MTHPPGFEYLDQQPDDQPGVPLSPGQTDVKPLEVAPASEKIKRNETQPRATVRLRRRHRIIAAAGCLLLVGAGVTGLTLRTPQPETAAPAVDGQAVAKPDAARFIPKTADTYNAYHLKPGPAALKGVTNYLISDTNSTDNRSLGEQLTKGTPLAQVLFESALKAAPADLVNLIGLEGDGSNNAPLATEPLNATCNLTYQRDVAPWFTGEIRSATFRELHAFAVGVTNPAAAKIAFDAMRECGLLKRLVGERNVQPTFRDGWAFFGDTSALVDDIDRSLAGRANYQSAISRVPATAITSTWTDYTQSLTSIGDPYLGILSKGLDSSIAYTDYDTRKTRTATIINVAQPLANLPIAAFDAPADATSAASGYFSPTLQNMAPPPEADPRNEPAPQLTQPIQLAGWLLPGHNWVALSDKGAPATITAMEAGAKTFITRTVTGQAQQTYRPLAGQGEPLVALITDGENATKALDQPASVGGLKATPVFKLAVPGAATAQAWTFKRAPSDETKSSIYSPRSNVYGVSWQLSQGQIKTETVSAFAPDGA